MTAIMARGCIAENLFYCRFIAVNGNTEKVSIRKALTVLIADIADNLYKLTKLGI